MSDSVIFLDVDGVLNSMRTPSWMGEDWDIPLARYLTQLRRIVDETGADIIVSSSWREHPAAMRKLEVALMVFELRIAGQTPICNLDRPREIQQWLADHPSVKHYVILDDELWMWTDEQVNKVAYTTANGLTADVAQIAINILLDDNIWED